MGSRQAEDQIHVEDPAKQVSGTFDAITGARAVAEVIATLDNPTVLGMPGGYTVQIFDALHQFRDRVSVNLLREESLATVMAEAIGRLRGEPAFVVGQGAWVLGNAGIGIMEAKLGCSPMVVLIDSTDGGTFSHLGPYQTGGGGYGAYDLAAAMRAITKETFVATNPTQALQMTRLAIKHAVTGEQGPVAVIFNGPSLYKRIDVKREPPAFLPRAYGNTATPIACDQSIEAAAQIIRAAKAPLIVAGNGIRLSQSQTELLQFAQQHEIPVVTTPAGKGVIPENNALALGVIGAFGHESANAAVKQADVIIALGTKLGASDTANQHPELINPARQKLIQVDIEPLNLSWTLPIDQTIVGDVASVLVQLHTTLDGVVFGGADTAAGLKHEFGLFDHAALATRADFSGRDVAAVLSQVLPPNGLVTCDAGENRLFILREFQSKESGDVLQPNGGGGMGYAVPSAMAGAYLDRNRTVVAVCGDGGISMTLHGLLSAIELGLKMTVLVMDNQALGWVYSSQRDRVIASELGEFDFAAIASAMGCRSHVAVDSATLRQALTDSFEHDGVSLVVAKISKTDRYQDVMSSLHKYDVYSVPENP